MDSLELHILRPLYNLLDSASDVGFWKKILILLIFLGLGLVSMLYPFKWSSSALTCCGYIDPDREEGPAATFLR